MNDKKQKQDDPGTDGADTSVMDKIIKKEKEKERDLDKLIGKKKKKKKE